MEAAENEERLRMQAAENEEGLRMQAIAEAAENQERLEIQAIAEAAARADRQREELRVRLEVVCRKAKGKYRKYCKAKTTC